ncbi:S-adenosyl-L-methionine-dependent methyltransferase, partial [Glonium stellatum]
IVSILNHAYNTSVSPAINRLKRAKHFDLQKTYGELEKSFVSSLLAAHSVSPGSRFVDLGSGVGNICLQAALETGCDSYGCELDAQRHQAAEAYLQQAGPVSRATNLLSRNVSLECGDIFRSKTCRAAIEGADLIVCSNFKLPEELIQKQEEHLRWMKPGARMVSFQPIVKGRTRRGKDLVVMLGGLGVTVTKETSSPNAASWTGSPVTYWTYSK